MKNIILATRSSRLATIQAQIVKDSLENQGVNITIEKVSTKGDKDRRSPINEIGGRGLFVKDIEEYLLDGRADIAVHSGKDLPYTLANGLIIAGTPKAADSEDCLIFRKGEAHKNNILIGTGSPRRITECKKFFPNAKYESIRGNVDTRLEKLKCGQYDAIILAKAGIDRLNTDLSEFDVRVFDTNEFIPSACQGIIAAECRENDSEIIKLLHSVSDEITAKRFEAERYMLSLMQADCNVALGVHSKIDGEEIEISAMFCGRRAVRSGIFENYKSICREIKDEIYG
ncbi:MAG: hydroxymethylbilane synthase [Clostridiales bacterium]|nr:hydroxymethylbilane synthase [Clostridiales bacterium]